MPSMTEAIFGEVGVNTLFMINIRFFLTPFC